MDERKRLRRTYNAIIAFGVLLLVMLLAYGGFYTVNEQERAVLTQFGKAVDVVGAGVHFKIPIVQQVEKVKMTIHGMEFGYKNEGGYDQTIESESFMITQDFNFVNVDFYVEWRVTDPVKYLFSSMDPEGLLRNILQSEARSVVSSYIVDEVLTTAKAEIQTKIRDGVLGKLEEYDIGITVVNVSLQDASPPTAEVVRAFKDVENAKQNKDTQINEAHAYFQTIIPAARAEADKIIKDAEAVKESRVNDAIGQTARFNEMFAEYTQNKEITKTRMYLEAMEEILPGVTLYVNDGGDLLKFLNLNTGVNVETGTGER